LKRLGDLEDSPLVPALLVKVLEEADKNLVNYKLAPLYEHKAVPYLREMTKRQIEKGLIRGDEDVATFRELIRVSEGQVYPSTQTAISLPTASELAMDAETNSKEN